MKFLRQNLTIGFDMIKFEKMIKKLGIKME